MEKTPEPMEVIQDLQQKFKQGNFAVKFIYINVAVYVLWILLRLISPSFAIELLSFLSLPSQIGDLLQKPWTLFTYMFVHESFFHLAFNMLMLYVVSNVFFSYFQDRAFALFYLIGGLAGGVLFLLFSLLRQETTVLLGASAAIFSVLFAIASYQPKTPIRLFFFEKNLPLLQFSIGLLLIGFLMDVNNVGGNISHVGGALFGYFYMKNFEKGKDFFSSFKSIFTQKKPRFKARKTPPRDDVAYNTVRNKKQQKTDKILEKISRSGYGSLTKEEKEFLFQQGK